MTKSEKLFYALGIIVSEGSFSGCVKPRLAVKQKDNLPLLKACRDVFGGRINGPYAHTYKDGVVRHYSVWCLDGGPLREALPVLAESMPPCHKKDQMYAWAQKYGLPL